MKKTLNKILQAVFDVLIGIAIFYFVAGILNIHNCPAMFLSLIGTALFAEFLEISKKE